MNGIHGITMTGNKYYLFLACFKIVKTKFGTIEQNLPQPFLMVLFGLTGRSRGSMGQCPLVRELRHYIRIV